MNDISTILQVIITKENFYAPPCIKNCVEIKMISIDNFHLVDTHIYRIFAKLFQVDVVISERLLKALTHNSLDLYFHRIPKRIRICFASVSLFSKLLPGLWKVPRKKTYFLSSRSKDFLAFSSSSLSRRILE